MHPVAAQLLGPVVMLPVTGMLSSSAGGWPSVFYASGALGVLVGVLVFMFVADSPLQHRSISALERDYIQRSISGNTRGQLKVSGECVRQARIYFGPTNKDVFAMEKDRGKIFVCELKLPLLDARVIRCSAKSRM